jgi:glycosyltransferase involved in cell wall biosynthesis
MIRDPRPVTILLCTLNGARFLDAQLQSYLRQSHEAWALWISDDGSTDGTLALLEAFRATHGGSREIRLLQGPRRGAAANYLSLLCHPELPAGVVALSDQDDIWLPGKLSRALRCLPVGSVEPLIYSAQSFYIDAKGKRQSGSRVPREGAPVFATAMLQNVMAGHSMVLNPQALALTRRAGPQEVAFHDWWLTLLVTASGGRAVLDARRGVLYRQHDGNVLGAPGSARAALLRAGQVLGYRYGDWVAANVRALNGSPDLTNEARDVVQRFATDPARSGWRRVGLLRSLGLRRQSRVGTLLCYLAAFLGRL